MVSTSYFRGGHDYHFTEEPPAFLICPVCLLPSKEPHLLSCCGKKVCFSCLSLVKMCPVCCAGTFGTLIDRDIERQILRLKVHCTNEENGCSWIGELRHLEHHLSACSVSQVFCKFECGYSGSRQEIVTHESNQCQLRPEIVLIKEIEQLQEALKESKDKLEEKDLELEEYNCRQRELIAEMERKLFESESDKESLIKYNSYLESEIAKYQQKFETIQTEVLAHSALISAVILGSESNNDRPKEKSAESAMQQQQQPATVPTDTVKEKSAESAMQQQQTPATVPTDTVSAAVTNSYEEQNTTVPPIEAMRRTIQCKVASLSKPVVRYGSSCAISKFPNPFGPITTIPLFDEEEIDDELFTDLQKPKITNSTLEDHSDDESLLSRPDTPLASALLKTSLFDEDDANDLFFTPKESETVFGQNMTKDSLPRPTAPSVGIFDVAADEDDLFSVPKKAAVTPCQAQKNKPSKLAQPLFSDDDNDDELWSSR